MMRPRLLVAAMLSLATPFALGDIDTTAALARSQAAIGTTPTEHAFVTASGKTKRLSDWRGKPLVVSFVYTSCPAVCPTVTANLKRATDVAVSVLGSGAFDVATIGFDTEHDTPARMASYARERGIDAPNWWFLAADADTIAALTNELGFTFAVAGGGFEHMTQVTILDAQGRIYRQIYGDDVPAPALVEPLKQLAVGESFAAPTLASVLDGVRLICSVYDPATGRYRFNYAIVTTVIAGALSLGGLGIFVLRLWRTS